MRRFFVDEILNINDIVSINPEDSHHIVDVLRMKEGDKLELVCDTNSFIGKICETNPLKVEILEELNENVESPIHIHLLQGLAKGEKMELVLQKSVEMGIFHYVAVACERSVVQLNKEKAAKKVERWEKIAESAAKQCGRNIIPEVSYGKSLEDAIKLLPEGTKIIMPWEAETEAPLKTLLTSLGEDIKAGRLKDIAVVIGPEGGFCQHEVDLCKSLGAETVTLGKRILRTETASIALVSILQYELGDLGGIC